MKQLLAVTIAVMAVALLTAGVVAVDAATKTQIIRGEIKALLEGHPNETEITEKVKELVSTIKGNKDAKIEQARENRDNNRQLYAAEKKLNAELKAKIERLNQLIRDIDPHITPVPTEGNVIYPGFAFKT